MKIGIITFHCADNYGAVLQCYALQEYLKSSGHEVCIIDYQPSYLLKVYNPKFNWKTTYLYFKNKKKLPLIRTFSLFIKSLNNYPFLSKKHKQFNEFRKNFLNTTNEDKFDLVIAGSDQIWSARITGGELDQRYFLTDFNAPTKKIAYAASCGGIVEKNIDLFKEYIQTLDNISTRELVLANQINKMGIKATAVLDPVFLLNKTDWNKLINKTAPLKEKYLLLYNVSRENTDNYIKSAIKFAKENNLKIILLGKDKRLKCKQIRSASPIEFLSYIYNAEYVYTTSFHATALSIILRKDFFVFKPDSPDRILNILEKSNLQKNIIDDNSYESFQYKKTDYSFIVQLDKEIIKSKKYLERNL